MQTSRISSSPKGVGRSDGGTLYCRARTALLQWPRVSVIFINMDSLFEKCIFVRLIM
jgi:hypothetical protein